MDEAYDQSFSPPAAVVRLAVSASEAAPALVVLALVDTGADVTVLPAGIPEQLGLPRIGVLRIRSAGGTTEIAALHAANVRLAGRRVSVEVIGLGHEALAGRDLLAHFVLTLDGPGRRLTIR